MILDSNHLNVLLFPNATKKATFLPFLPYDAFKKKKKLNALSTFSSGLAEGQTDWYE